MEERTKELRPSAGGSLAAAKLSGFTVAATIISHKILFPEKDVHLVGL